MDTPDRPDGALAPWTPSPPARGGAAPWDEPAAGPAAAGPRMFSPRVVLRALRRHWWRILAVWLVGSAGLVYLAYTKIRPVYEATAWLQVEPPTGKVLSGGLGAAGAADFAPYLETQVLLVTSPDVLMDALSKPAVAHTRKVATSADPEVELRREIAVGIPQRGTHLIQVRLTGENPTEAAVIVNAVVDAYLHRAQTWTDEASKQRLKNLQDLETTYQKYVNDMEVKVRELARKDNGNVPVRPGPAGGPDDAKGAPGGLLDITLEQHRALTMSLLALQIERHKAAVTVQYLEDDLKARGGAPAARGPMTEDQIVEQVRQEYIVRPEAARLMNERDEAKRKYEVAAKRVRNGLDPTITRTKRDMEEAEAAYQDHWHAAYPRLRRLVEEAATAGPADPESLARERNLSDARLELKKIELNEKLLDKQIAELRVEVKRANDEILDLQSAQRKQTSYENDLAKVRQHKEDMELEARQGARAKLIAAAKGTRSPSGDNRTKAIVAAPVVMLALSCLMFILLEFKSGRVADPDELSQRVRVGVIGVVPPLPSPRSSGRALSLRGQRDERRKVEEFVQSLDHLRVTLCAPRPGHSDRRCVLITSATGGEGKTTLAAQLAGRCANAGLMTLLVDADLRRPSLGDLLEVPEGPGLVDVLAGEVAPEAAMVVIGNAGGFHLLPAGTLGQDPSRLLHGERLGKLIAQFRETFDMVIIDAPPVLAVPDALLLGRWTDGAVLAVRHDASRFPLVERANRRLASVGVAVLGAVVNGCRTMESAYGSYRYTPYAAADAPGAGGEADVDA